MNTQSAGQIVKAGIKSSVCEVHLQADLKKNEVRDGTTRTLIAKNKVNPMEPKYAAVNGSRGPEIRCLA